MLYLIAQTDPAKPSPGESWLWQNPEEFRVVIDVGDHEPFAERAAAFDPDILILTHDDDDHVGSALDFFKHRGVRGLAPSTRMANVARSVAPRRLEVWLPYDWLRLGLAASEVKESAASSDGGGTDDASGGMAVARDADDRDQRGDEFDAHAGALSSAQGETDGEGLTVEEAEHNEERFGGSIEATPENGSAPVDGEGDVRDNVERRSRDLTGQPAAGRSSEVLNAIRDYEAGSVHEDPSDPEADFAPAEWPEPGDVGGDVLPHDMIEALESLGESDLPALAKAATQAVKRGREANQDAVTGRGKWVGSHRQVGERIAKTAVDVAAIIVAASHADATFRFFDPDLALLLHHRDPARPVPWIKQGKPGIVTIVNASQVRPYWRRSKTPSDDLDQLAHLTVQNRRALVTFLWPSNVATERRADNRYVQVLRDGGALVWSDSEHRILKQKPTESVVPWRYVSVMSAPHHASVDGCHVDIWRARPHHVLVLLSHNSQPDTVHFTEGISSDRRDCTRCASARARDAGAVTEWGPFWWNFWARLGVHWGRMPTHLIGNCSDDHRS